MIKTTFATDVFNIANTKAMKLNDITKPPNKPAKPAVFIVLKAFLNTFDFTETDNTTFNFLDSQLDYNGSAVTTISGLSHLEGQTVQILADGSTHADKIVSSGGITLDRSSKKVKVGLGYNSILQTMRIEGGSAEGTGQGKVKRISKVVLRLFNTVGVKCGPSLTNLESVPFRTTSSDMDNPDQSGAFLINLIPTTGPQSSNTNDLVSDIRNNIVPNITKNSTLQINVTGLVATNTDFTDYLAGRLLLFFSAILAVSFLFLLIVFPLFP